MSKNSQYWQHRKHRAKVVYAQGFKTGFLGLDIEPGLVLFNQSEINRFRLGLIHGHAKKLKSRGFLYRILAALSGRPISLQSRIYAAMIIKECFKPVRGNVT